MPYLTTPDGLTALQSAIARGLQQFTPPPDLKVSEWADRYARLPRESSPEPGQWVTGRAEYQREPMDIFLDPLVETVVLMWAAQTGKSAIELNILGYFAHQDPSPVLIVMPTLETAEAFSKDRIAPMIRDTPVLASLFGDPRSRDSGNTLLHKQFPGGHLTLAGANSPASLAMRPIRIVMADEIDRFPPSAGTEGDPLNLARKRTANFWNRKIIESSTPTIRGASRIEREFERSDQRYFLVPCPQCKTRQRLLWSRLKWPSPKTGAPAHQPQNCYYVCEDGCEITEADKPWMIANGAWKASVPGGGDGKTVGYHLNALYSTFITWPELIGEFLKVKDDPGELKVFTNTVLAETWEIQGESVDKSIVSDRRETYAAAVPAGVLLLTAGVDVQSDRLEIEVDGWGNGEESWAIEHKVFVGNPALIRSRDPANPTVWEQLDTFLQQKWRHELGLDIRIACCMVDSGGHHTRQVYQFCRVRELRRVYACKGSSTPGAPLLNRPSRGRGKRSGALLWMVGTGTAKELLYSRLKRVDKFGPGYCHYPMAVIVDGKPQPLACFDGEYFDQLTAEKMTTKLVGGQTVIHWIKTRPRNEALDLRVYSMAALEALRPNWEALMRNLTTAAAAVRPAEPAPPKVEKPIVDTPPGAAAERSEPARGRRVIRPKWINSWRV